MRILRGRLGEKGGGAAGLAKLPTVFLGVSVIMESIDEGAKRQWANLIDLGEEVVTLQEFVIILWPWEHREAKSTAPGFAELEVSQVNF